MRSILFLMLFLLLRVSYSQDQKVALVLSGGAAKGMAHIPLLKALDSLHLVPDVVVGNSMGSVVGGLYAMGYSGKEIEELADTVDWDRVLSNKIPFSYINPIEKDEYNKYILELPFQENSLSVPLGVIEGQELSLLLSRLTSRVDFESDFDKFPIPFRCVATDLTNGTLKVFEKGDVATAIRASMAIPTVFTPVEYEGSLLIDGGVLNNFPVNVAREMGMDIIIGSDVSGGFVERPESMMNLLVESSMISASILNEQQREGCDILIDHVPHLEYESSDFYSAGEIIKNGEEAVVEKLDQLVKLVKEASKGEIKRKSSAERSASYEVSNVRFLDTSSDKKRLLQGRTLLDSSNVTLDALERIVRISYGSRLYDKLNYRMASIGETYELLVKTEERTPTMVKAGLHFDTERGAGIILNVTARDLLGTNSRALATVDLAQNPKIRLQYQQYFKDPKWWYRLEGFRERVDQATYVSGRRSGDFQFDYAEAFAQLNRDISNYTTLSGALVYNRDSYRPGISPEAKNISADSVTDEITTYRFQNIGGRAAVYQNNLDHRYFPTKGREFRVVANYYPFARGRINWYSNLRQDERENLRHIFQFEVSWLENFQVGERLVIRPQFHAGSFFTNDLSFYDIGTIRFFVLGGIDPRANKQYINFAGLREGELPVSQLTSASISAQWEFINRLYLIPSINAASIGAGSPREYFRGFSEFSTDWQNNPTNAFAYSFDLNLSVDTPIGPMQLQASKVNRVDNLRFYFSIGYFLF